MTNDKVRKMDVKTWAKVCEGNDEETDLAFSDALKN